LRTQTNFFAVPVALLLISLSVIAAVWVWLGSSIPLPRQLLDPAVKLDCVSYAPFRGTQSPFVADLVIGPEQIAEDLAQLAKVTRCVRIYSVDNGLDKVPGLASRFGLKVNLGVWIGRDRIKNAQLVEQALALVEANSNVVTSITVGSEVLLRGEMTPEDLRAIIRSVKARANVPVSYADVWEFWLQYRGVAEDVDFVTIHILPYWEDRPVRAEQAAAYVDDVRRRVAAVFPGKDVVIGETGWPSNGRMRGVARPSRINQARFISEILDRAEQENFRVNLFEAYDARWKRQWEGTVGGHWGLFDVWHRLKYPRGVAVSDHPFWKLQFACGAAYCALVFAVAVLVRRRARLFLHPGAWIAVAVSATTGGSLLGLAAEKLLFESYGLGDWLVRGVLLVTAIAAPLQSSHAMMSGHALPTFFELLGPRGDTPLSRAAKCLGFTWTLATLIATEIALGLIFDPRWRDFPFADLTMVAVSFSMLTQLNGSKVAVRPLAEALFAGLFAVAAIYILLNEGFDNWQSLWTSTVYGLFGLTLWRASSVVVAPVMASSLTVVPADAIVEPAERR
jgi:exo-beta-1,3-glucanase (GH17 family)